MKQRHLILTVLCAILIAGNAHSSSADIACDDGKRYYNLARQAGASQDYEKAVDWLRKSVNACDSYSAWHLMGTAYQNQRLLPDALAAYEQAVAHAGDRDQAALSMARYGKVMALNGQRFEALTMLERAIDLHSSPPSWMQDSARELDQSLAESPISSDSIKRSLASQQFGLLSMAKIEQRATGGGSRRVRVRIPINYKLDSVEMDDLTIDNLEELGKVLSGDDYAGRKFTLEGHTDVRGAWDYNLALSERRAEAARDALEARFPSLKGRLRAVGAGEAKPKYPGEQLSEADHRLNRRLEILVN